MQFENYVAYVAQELLYFVCFHRLPGFQDL